MKNIIKKNVLLKAAELNREYRNSLFQTLYQLRGEKSKIYFADLISNINRVLHGNENYIINHTKLSPVRINYPLLEKSKHDVAYWYKQQLLFMTEHQSTFCQNIILRFLLYLARAYEKWINEKKFAQYLYKGKFPESPPVPNFMVLYNGNKDIDFAKSYNLSSLFGEDFKAMQTIGDIEMSVKYIDIRYDSVKDNFAKCESLYQYSKFTAMYEQRIPLTEIIKEFPKNSCLGEILKEEGVLAMLAAEFNQRDLDNALMEASKAEGKAEGKVEGIMKVAKNLLIMNIPLEHIMQATGLTREQLEALS